MHRLLDITQLQPLKIKKLSSMIEDSIKDLVLTGQLKQGDKLPTEKELSGKYGVSLVTIREALRGLEASGVLEKKRGRDGGVFISSNGNTVKDVVSTFLTFKKYSAKDVSETRGIIQPFCARLAASRISPGLLNSLESNIKYCEDMLQKSQRTFTEKEFFEIEEKNVEFHKLIGEATGNPILALTVDYVENFVLIFKKNTLKSDFQHTSKTIEEHRQIFKYLQKSDEDKTEKAMVLHLRNIEEYLQLKEH
jgi:GntR family transcriptional regulator, transcriptional repressor for pyruvate dehydrogenase complex